MHKGFVWARRVAGRKFRSRTSGCFRQTGGFTLVELAVVIAVAALFALILRPALSGDLEMKRRAECLDNQRKIGQMMLAYAADYDGYYPHAFRGPDNRQLRLRGNDYFGRTTQSMLLVEGYAGESGEMFRCPSHDPDDREVLMFYPVYRYGSWARSTTGTGLREGTPWRAYNIYAGYIQHEGGDPELITDWHMESPGMNPFPHYRASVRTADTGRKVLGGDNATGTWEATPAPSRGQHLNPEGTLAGANFFYNDGSASWSPFTGYNFDHFAHYRVPANFGHTAGWAATVFYYLPGPDIFAH